MNEILWSVRTDRRDRPQFHQRCTIAIEDDDRACGVERNTEAHAAGAAHGPDLVEMLIAIVEGKQLTTAKPGRRDHRGARGNEFQEAFENAHPDRCEVASTEIVERPLHMRRGALVGRGLRCRRSLWA